MNSEIQTIWQEIISDLTTPAIAWQIAIIIAAIAIAWMINGVLRQAVMQRAPEHWKLAIGSVNRVLFPLSTLTVVLISQIILSKWQHVGLLQLSSRLLLAMAAIRLILYFVRYLFPPGGWLKTLESIIAWSIWGVLVLHLTGVLPEIALSLENIQFNVGKNQLNLLLVLQALVTIVITIFAALWVSRMVENKLMRTEHVNANLRVVLSKLIRILLMFIALLVALSAVGLDLTLLSVFGGALGVGLGFGMQRIASNYVSGFIILLDKSMQIGDVLTVDKHYGVVSDMRSRYMVLSKLDGSNVIIPNELLIIGAVINHSLTEHKGRVLIRMAINYDSPLELAMRLMCDSANNHVRVLQNPTAEVQIEGFNEHGIVLVLTVWIEDPEKGAAGLQSALLMNIWKQFKQNAIFIAKLEPS